MNNFQIFDDEHPAPEKPASTYFYDEGNWRYRGIGNIQVFAFEDEGDDVVVWIAEKPRTAVIEVEEPAYKLGSRFGVRSYA